jgi:hypothetical protein
LSDGFFKENTARLAVFLLLDILLEKIFLCNEMKKKKIASQNPLVFFV